MESVKKRKKKRKSEGRSFQLAGHGFNLRWDGLCWVLSVIGEREDGRKKVIATTFHRSLAHVAKWLGDDLVGKQSGGKPILVGSAKDVADLHATFVAEILSEIRAAVPDEQKAPESTSEEEATC